MTPAEAVWHQIGLLAAAGLAILLAILGDLTRIMHEAEQGGPQLSWQRTPAILVRGVVMGIVAAATSAYLSQAYQVPELAGGALGGILGYTGPSVLGTGLKYLLERYLPAKPKEPGE